MSSKREEKAAFETLKKEFPNTLISLQCEYATHREYAPSYYVTICGDGVDVSGVGSPSPTVKEAVDLIIKLRKEALERQKEEAKAEPI